MWLLTQNRILIKDNLLDKEWTGSTQCHFCTQEETVDHLFIQCPFVRQIWFWLGDCQDLFSTWHSIDDIMTFVYSLSLRQQQSFLVAFSALAWCVWKQRNLTLLIKLSLSQS